MGGDHKCPLCSATFTRPQHVGRHLRAHTGDRPYECKECPLRFARSDLLSRHVNKAHKPPDENASQEKKPVKKGRRKSFPASAIKKPNPNGEDNDNNGQTATAKINNSQVREKPRSASFNQQPQLQAQRMYPHHPLLAGPGPSNSSIQQQQQPPQVQTWSTNPSQAFATTVGMTNLSSSPYNQTFLNPVTSAGNPNAILGNPTNPNTINNLPTFDPPFTAAPMKMSGSEQGYSSIGQVPVNNNNGILYEWGFKKRACDQCNHSKVRCDFADPCLRCTHRNIKCSYNKPQRSRTIGYPFVPSQSTVLQQVNTGVTARTAGATSTSPQSLFSSPHSSSSPVSPIQLPAHQMHQRNNSISSLPSNLSIQSDNNIGRQWGSHTQTSGMQPPSAINAWQTIGQPPFADMPIGTAPGSITGQVQQSPASVTMSLQGAAPLRPPIHHQGGVNRSQDNSPQQGLAPTPSLTNNTTSPPDIDEPFERRDSYTGTTGGFLAGQEWQSQNQKKPTVAPTLQTHKSDPAYIVPFNSSPVQYSPTSIDQVSTNVPFSNEYAYQWPAQPTQTFGSNWQAPPNPITDDDATSALSSSTHSTFLNVDDSQFENALQQHRRRSSAGQWAAALAQMSLQDTLSSTESPIIPLPEPYSNNGTIDPSATAFGGGPGQQVPARRPTFPTLTGVTEESEPETQAMPSLSDVKDLWRLFMAEPMTGLTPLGEHNDLELNTNTNGMQNVPLPTPRPGMGKRTLSKSNSMPDLQSPMINGPQFFNNLLNGLTPKPTDPQNSYIPNQQPAAGTDVNGNSSDNADMRKWSKEIQQRQSSFSLSGQPNAKLGKTTSQQSLISNMGPPLVNMNLHVASSNSQQRVRPQPSVVQRSSALEQTLAPERIPSFGIPQSLLGADNHNNNHQFVPSKLNNYNNNNVLQQGNKFLSGVPPHMARPGNKRLASQTLVGDAGKKATFDLYDGDENQYQQQDVASYDQQQQQQQQQMVNQRKISGQTHMQQSQQSTHVQSQQQQQQQQQQQAQIQTQANSMFYPNWSLNPQPVMDNRR